MTEKINLFRKLFNWWLDQVDNRLGRHRWHRDTHMFIDYIFWVITIFVIIALIFLPLIVFNFLINVFF